MNINKTNGNLEFLARKGILLLNTILTVQENVPLSHKNKGWEKFTDLIIKEINDKKNNVIFFLWGNEAIKKKNLITNKTHLVLESSHPSPLGAYKGFIGCNHFKIANQFFLEKYGESVF